MYNENDYIMWLNSIFNINNEKKIELIDYFGSAKELYSADKIDIIESNIITEKEYRYIKANRFSIENELEKLSQSPVRFITYKDSDFPKQLMKMNNPPLGMYIWGKLPKSTYPFVSIVGTRKVSEYGAVVCNKIAGELAEKGITVVSGMAYGVDTVAHKACIDSGGKTIAVLGNGVDICYPAGNRSLRDSIVKNGCLISEFPLGTKSNRFNFPYRNRIIACISSMTVVIEGEHKSGTLITASHALDNGRIVMAVPGNITSRLSEAPNKLIADGCRPVLKTQDILDELNIKIDNIDIKNIKKMPDIDEEEKIIFDLIDYEPVTVDELCLKSNMSIDFVNSILLMLELKGCIMKLSGQKYVRSI